MSLPLTFIIITDIWTDSHPLRSENPVDPFRPSAVASFVDAIVITESIHESCRTVTSSFPVHFGYRAYVTDFRTSQMC